MDNKVYTLEEMEDFCLGKLSLAEQLTFEKQLASDAQLQRQVRLLQSILDGFTALQTEIFSEKMHTWSEEVQEEAYAELVEWYLQGELGVEARHYVEQKRKTDTSFDALFRAQQALLEGFEAARSEAFVEQMSQWKSAKQAEVPVRKLGPWVRRFAIAASVLFLLGWGGWAYMKSQFSNEKLFASSYQSPNIGGTMGGQTLDQFREEFTAAHRSLQARRFAEAMEQFKDLQTSMTQLELDPLAKAYYEDNLEWSLLLARLGNDQVDEDFMTELEGLAKNTEHEYQEAAQQLLAKLNSFWR